VTSSARPPLTWLYVPGDRPDRFDSAVRSGADVVVIDWEDAVAPARKSQARGATMDWLGCLDRESVTVEIRVNALDSADSDDDLSVLAAAAVPPTSVRLPKVTSADQVQAVASVLPPRIEFTCLLESARGVENAAEIAAASERVTRIALGEADLAADLGVTDPAGLDWCRSRLVVASRSAGMEPPPMSAWTAIADEVGLRDSCRIGRARGFLGRAAVHPRQVPVIAAAFVPDAAELAAAREVRAAFDRSRAAGSGVVVDAAGRMIDLAVVRSAERTLKLVDRA
jgi:citrate lyase subunit beta/citryl-CoA lyase